MASAPLLCQAAAACAPIVTARCHRRQLSTGAAHPPRGPQADSQATPLAGGASQQLKLSTTRAAKRGTTRATGHITRDEGVHSGLIAGHAAIWRDGGLVEPLERELGGETSAPPKEGEVCWPREGRTPSPLF